ncbi:nuclear transport factor 2 family protein [Flavobacterium hungaricum]|uniref:Nuclear transport factor 2 family protein n=1 Tax=Flavobacterium hungaricum TaxID=2082725 RepID=A0ABR9TH95_9FLAO|nr:nuclear transport factor 2 family protein [Flavobacterium hungaricum]MBE8724407.1 nuclear transport factor 2 family protein [Flavobacterium hungaricum]
MNLPEVIQDLIKAQNDFDSANFANCFSETAIVFDEGKNYTGKTEIQNWIEKASKEYNATMKPISFAGDAKEGSLKAEVSGTFPGSPLVLTYHFQLEAQHIQTLKID